MQQQAEKEAAGSFFRYFLSPGTQLLHPLAGPSYFFYSDKQLKTLSQLSSFCVKTNLLFYTIKNSLNQSHSIMSLVPFQRVWWSCSMVQCFCEAEAFPWHPEVWKAASSLLCKRGCPTFCKRLPLNQPHQTVWLYFSYCNTDVLNLSSAPGTAAKYSSCIIAFYCWLKSLSINYFPSYPWKSHKHHTRQKVMHLEPPLQSATAMF